jgi:hypothetical protein
MPRCSNNPHERRLIERFEEGESTDGAEWLLAERSSGSMTDPVIIRNHSFSPEARP